MNKTRIDKDSFQTSYGEDVFTILVTGESDWSVDGGHSFEDVTLMAELSRADAKELIEELKHFVEEGREI